MLRKLWISNIVLLIVLSGMNSACIRPALKIGTMPREANCVAVAPFEVRFGLSYSEELLSEFLALDLSRMGANGILGPREMVQLFKQVRDPLPPSIDPYWAKLIGQRLNLDAIIFGSISQIPLLRDPGAQELHVNVEVYLLDLKSGEMRWAFSLKEAMPADDYVRRLSLYSEEMAESLLRGRGRKARFGKSNCWARKPVAMTKLAEQKPKAEPIVLADKELKTLNQLLDSQGYVLGADAFEGRFDRLTKGIIPFLRTLSRILQSKNVMGKRLHIGSHLDGTDNTANDLRLSKMRAEAIERYLTSQGINSEMIMAKGFGGTKPLVPNINRRSRNLNRRTTLSLKTLGSR